MFPGVANGEIFASATLFPRKLPNLRPKPFLSSKRNKILPNMGSASACPVGVIKFNQAAELHFTNENLLTAVVT